jgi:hypothetical protein
VKPRVDIEVSRMRNCIVNRAGDDKQLRELKAWNEVFCTRLMRKSRRRSSRIRGDGSQAQTGQVPHHPQKDDNNSAIASRRSFLQHHFPEPVFQLNQESCLRSSLLQKASESLAGEETVVNCANFYQRGESKVTLAEEKKLRAEWESVKAAICEILDASDHDFIELYIAFLEKTEQNSFFYDGEFSVFLDQELSVFKNGEKYEFVKDFINFFTHNSEKPALEKILDLILFHIF